jgi:hypothetical protein
VCSPYLHRRDCGTPKPGKKKQKRYDYGCAILILHCNHLSCWLIRIHAKGFKVEKKGKDSRYLALIIKRLCRDSFPEIYNLVARNKLSVWIQIEAALAHFWNRSALVLNTLWRLLANRVIQLMHATFYSRSHDAVIRVYDEAGNVIETHEHAGEFKEW